MTTILCIARRLLPAAALLLIGACVPLQPNGGAVSTATPPHESSAAAVATVSASTTSTESTSSVVAPAVNHALMLSTPVTVTITGPISPGRGIVGPVGEPVMHGAPVGNPAANDDSN